MGAYQPSSDARVFSEASRNTRAGVCQPLLHDPAPTMSTIAEVAALMDAGRMVEAAGEIVRLHDTSSSDVELLELLIALATIIENSRLPDYSPGRVLDLYSRALSVAKTLGAPQELPLCRRLVTVLLANNQVDAAWAHAKELGGLPYTERFGVGTELVLALIAASRAGEAATLAREMVRESLQESEDNVVELALLAYACEGAGLLEEAALAAKRALAFEMDDLQRADFLRIVRAGGG